MDTAVTHEAGRGPEARTSGPLARWAALVLLFGLVWAFMFILAPALEKTDMVRPMTEYVEQSGIDASALYYTELDETSEAEMYLRDSEMSGAWDGDR